MLELTGFGSVLRGIGVLYWLLTIGAIALALYKNKTPRTRTIWVTVVVLVFGFLPAKQMVEQYQKNAFTKEAWAYFKNKCDTEAGEKIYKTFTGLKSVLVVKPLPPATEKDLYDQFWMGDPYSAPAHSQRGRLEAAILASQDAPSAFDQLGRGFDFVESSVTSDKAGEKKFVKYSYPLAKRGNVQQPIDQPISRFGILWNDISNHEDRKYWVAGSRLQVIDLADNSIVAERIGYLIEPGFGSIEGQRRPWGISRGPNTTCPSIKNGTFEDRWFILKVLNPIEGGRDGK